MQEARGCLTTFRSQPRELSRPIRHIWHAPSPSERVAAIYYELRQLDKNVCQTA
jgi:hypothetical protein